MLKHTNTIDKIQNNFLSNFVKKNYLTKTHKILNNCYEVTI